jgi:GR25 family glycosyltransferase involved in LPS biosynthesis
MQYEKVEKNWTALIEYTTRDKAGNVNQPETKLPDCWAFFDRIYCISLDKRTDRRAEVSKQFAVVGLLDRVEFVIVTKHPVNQEKGIFQSHMKCLEKGLGENARNILIFEDDVFFQGFDGQTVHEVCTYLDSAANWDALFLGCITNGSSRTEKKNLVRITYRCLAHAYALNESFARKIVQQPWSGVPFDELLRRDNADFYALYPMCAFQGLAGSDNQTVVIDRLRRLFGGLPFIQRVSEFYQNNKVVLFPVSLTGLLLLALLIFKMW